MSLRFGFILHRSLSKKIPSPFPCVKFININTHNPLNSENNRYVYIFFIHRNFYNANPRPDALMKEQIVEMSGLSPRVIRVWFQNKRCKDKKNQIKMEMQHEKVSCIVKCGIHSRSN